MPWWRKGSESDFVSSDPLVAEVLTGQGDAGGGEAAQTSPPAQPLRPGPEYNPAKRREETRSILALGLGALFFIVSVMLVVLVAWNLLSDQQAKDLAAEVLSPIVAVTGTALGFYFGGHRDGK